MNNYYKNTHVIYQRITAAIQIVEHRTRRSRKWEGWMTAIGRKQTFN